MPYTVNIPPPGHPKGPCADECPHLDCAQSRKDAALVCTDCNTVIGYSRDFYWTNDGNVHADCYAKRPTP